MTKMKRKVTAAEKAVVPKAARRREIAKRKPSAIIRTTISEAEVIEAFDVLGITAKLSDERTKRLFIKMAVRNGLDPLKREIHAVERKVKVTENVPGKGEIVNYVTVLTPVVGYEVFVDRAEESGRLQYWYPIEEGEISTTDLSKSTYKATIVIKRRDWPKEFRWTVKHREVAVDNPMWRKEPSHQTIKTCISRAFRLCFRDVLKGMPFTDVEEYSRAEYVDVEARPALQEPKALPKPDEGNAKRALDDVEFKVAHQELRDIFTACLKSKLFGDNEESADLHEMAEQAKIAVDKKDLQSMRDLAVAWQIEMAERRERKERKNG